MDLALNNLQSLICHKPKQPANHKSKLRQSFSQKENLHEVF